MAVESTAYEISKKPKRILYFSDGTLEEYSSDENENPINSSSNMEALLDPKSLSWMPWFWYWMSYTGNSFVAACDCVGESLANFFGITSPKYQYEIEEYHRTVEEEKKEKEEMVGWVSSISPVIDKKSIYEMKSSKDDSKIDATDLQSQYAAQQYAGCDFVWHYSEDNLISRSPSLTSLSSATSSCSNSSSISLTASQVAENNDSSSERF